MIIVQLTGGLGNQLFQYAMGRSLAIKNKSEYKIDISFFEDYEWHEYSLKPFSIGAPVATKEECDLVKNKQQSLLNRILRKTIGGGEVVIWEKNLLYNPVYKKIKDPAYLHGYWQCEKYFEDYADVIRKEFMIHILPSEANKNFLVQIENTQAVSLHIRRGNFVAVEEFNKVIGTCSMDYYDRAIGYIKQRVSDPVFFVFSDDIPWAKANLNGPEKYLFIDINDAQHDYEDLRLMQHCKHHIMANSTFSWWGAWLNPSKDKIVIAPDRWFADEMKNQTAVNIIPENWIKL